MNIVPTSGKTGAWIECWILGRETNRSQRGWPPWRASLSPVSKGDGSELIGLGQYQFQSCKAIKAATEAKISVGQLQQTVSQKIDRALLLLDLLSYATMLHSYLLLISMYGEVPLVVSLPRSLHAPQHLKAQGAKSIKLLVRPTVITNTLNLLLTFAMWP